MFTFKPHHTFENVKPLPLGRDVAEVERNIRYVPSDQSFDVYHCGRIVAFIPHGPRDSVMLARVMRFKANA